MQYLYNIKFRHLLLFTLLLVLQSFGTSAQNHKEAFKLSGVVLTEEGSPLPGARIRISGASDRGTVTDTEGRFSLITTLGETLEVAYIGMISRRVEVKDNKPLKIILKENISTVSELVVTGYQKIPGRVYTGAASLVKMKDIKLDGVADISRMLEGRVPGLTIQNISGTFGTTPRINIRGGASIIGSVQPLWVVDGVMYEDHVNLSPDDLASGNAGTLIGSVMAGINANDIEDIQVLKDASATSLYGARALNGVIVVTTRRGRRETPLQISYSGELSFRAKPSYSSANILDSQETMAIYMEMERKGYFDLRQALYGRRSGVYYRLYKGMSTIDPTTGDFYISATSEGKREFLKRHEYANTNWMDQLFTLNPTHAHTLTVTGGGKHIASYASLSLYEDKGWSIIDKVNRMTANLNNTLYINDRLNASLSLQGSLRKQLAPGTLPQRKNTRLGTFERDFDINPYSYAVGTSRTLSPYEQDGSLAYYRNNWAPFNILNEYAHNYMNLNVFDFKIQGDVTYKPVRGLKLRALISSRQSYTANTHHIGEPSNVVQVFRAHETPEVARENIYLLRDDTHPLSLPKVALTHGGILNKSETTMRSDTYRISMEYDRNSGVHDLRSFAFAEVRKTDRSINPFAGYGIQYDRGNQVFTNPLIIEKLTKEGDTYFGLTELRDRGITFSWSGTYGYDHRYILHTVVNMEGSNTAGANHRARWLPTWNVGGKWNIHEEEYMKEHPYVNRLALRASYGLTAKINDAVLGSDVIYKNAQILRPNLSDRESAIRIYQLENRDLSWEKMYELNLGVDVGILQDRVSATVDLYRRDAFDLIDLVRTSGIGGQYYKYANYGDMRTMGVELSLYSTNILAGDFSWKSNLSLSLMHQTVTRLLNSPNTFDLVAGRGLGSIVGFPKGGLYSFNFQGLNNVGLPTFDFGLYPSNNGKNMEISGANFSDAQFSRSYLIYHGPIEPRYTGGLTNTFSYKGWELSLFLTMQAGYKIRLNPTFDPAFGDLNVFGKEYLKRWLVAEDEWHTDVPVIPSKDLIRLYGEEEIERAYNTYNFSQMRVADGSFVRLKNVSLSYRLPADRIKSWGMKSASLRLNITNPVLLYSDRKLQGQDPEFYKSGGVALPTPQQVTLTLNMGY